MSEVLALSVHIIDVKDNFVHLHRKYLNQFRNPKNDSGVIKIEGNGVHYASCSPIAFNGNGENAFNVNSVFAKSLEIEESDAVIISNFCFVQSLKTAVMSPMRIDDLPIMEDRAETIQETLLNQIRIISKHQKLTIWISKSVSVQVHVDKLDSELDSGRLEEHTEVVISFNTSACNDCHVSKFKGETSSKSSSTWEMFRSMFSFTRPTDISTENATEPKFYSLGVFRCALIADSLFNFNECIQHYPYNAFISRHHRISEKEGDYSIHRLTHLPYFSSKTSKEVSEKKADSFSRQVFVYLYEINDTDVVDEIGFRQVNSYPTIFVSRSVYYSLQLRINSKVKLESVTFENKYKPTQIDFTMIRGEAEQEDLIRKIRNLFRAPLNRGIVNNGSLIVLNGCIENIILLRFNPISVLFVEMSEADMLACVLRAGQHKPDLQLLDQEIQEGASFPFFFQQKIIGELQMSLLIRLRLTRLSMDDYDCNLENNHHTILEGDSGTGKSFIMMSLKEKLERSSYQIFFKNLECKSLKGKLISKLEKLLENALIECLHHEPAVLCFDDLDVLLVSSNQNPQVQYEAPVTSYSNRLSHLIFDLVSKYSKHRIAVLATVKNCSSLESRLLQARGISLFSDRIIIPVMDQVMRRECLVQFFSAVPIRVNADNLAELVRRTESYCVQDLSDLVNKLYFEGLKRCVDVTDEELPWLLQKDDVDEALISTLPLALIGINLHKSSSVSWKDVGGLETAKRVLAEVLIWPSLFPEIFEQCPLTLQSGVLLYGVPGSGKTLLASAVAGEAGLNFISIKGPELLSKFVGESEQGIRDTFQRRGNDITGVTDRVVNQLLTELDGVEAICGVWVLAATSRPDLIDPALLRPGRLGTAVRCPLPNEEERRLILEIIKADLPKTEEDIDWPTIAAATDGYTGADLKAVLYTAMTMCDTTRFLDVEAGCLEALSLQFDATEAYKKKLDTLCFLKAVEETTPSLRREEVLSYQIIYEQFERKDEKVHLPAEQRVTLA